MSTPREIISMVSSLMNDTAQTVYTEVAVLPYLNMALNDLQETFEQHNVPTTNEVSDVITIPSGTNTVAFRTYPGLVEDPTIPSNLIEIKQVWESPTGTESWTPLIHKEFLPPRLQNVETSKFLYWAWDGKEIELYPANQDIDIKIDYVKSIFEPVTEATLQTDLAVKNIKSYLGYRTASLCAMYIGENSERAAALAADAEVSLQRTLGISAKGRQSINTRRKPFRAGWKRGAYF
jgi:hypothetical protein